jgi:hypothetical protein
MGIRVWSIVDLIRWHSVSQTSQNRNSSFWHLSTEIRTKTSPRINAYHIVAATLSQLPHNGIRIGCALDIVWAFSLGWVSSLDAFLIVSEQNRLEWSLTLFPCHHQHHLAPINRFPLDITAAVLCTGHFCCVTNRSCLRNVRRLVLGSVASLTATE